MPETTCTHYQIERCLYVCAPEARWHESGFLDDRFRSIRYATEEEARQALAELRADIDDDPEALYRLVRVTVTEEVVTQPTEAERAAACARARAHYAARRADA